MRSYQHHIGDFNNATRHLDRIERSIYRDLIELYYDIEGPLPLDIATICRRIIARSNEESTLVESSLNEFFTETPTGWYHTRCEHEIDKYKSSNSQRALAGKASAAKKALKRQQALNGNSTSVEISLNGESTGNQNLNLKPKPNNESTNVDSKRKQKPAIDLSAWESKPSAGTMTDWAAMRKAKHAPLSQTVINKLTPEINLAVASGYTADDCLSLCILKGWQGFKFQWLKNEESNNANNQRNTRTNRSDRNTQAHRDYIADLERQAEVEAGRCLADPAEPALGY